jgi:siroheme synthase (precorrin-2 oxidase/ferrochelatase)
MVKNEDRVRKLTMENQTLLDRWLKKAAEDAEKMNEANALYESVMEQAKFLEHKKKQDDELAKSQANVKFSS